jgi:hypothetical protein
MGALPNRLPMPRDPLFLGWWMRLAASGLLILLVIAGAAGGSFGSRAAVASGPTEVQVKSALVYNFIKFVDWPASRFAEANSPIVIGVAGSSELRDELEGMVRGRRLYGRELSIVTIDGPEAAKSTHILFISRVEGKGLDELLGAVRGSAILTLGETREFAKRGGMIWFVPEQGKLRFEINIQVVEESGLRISAQLQKLAKSVHRTL